MSNHDLNVLSYASIVELDKELGNDGKGKKTVILKRLEDKLGTMIFDDLPSKTIGKFVKENPTRWDDDSDLDAVVEDKSKKSERPDLVFPHGTFKTVESACLAWMRDPEYDLMSYKEMAETCHTVLTAAGKPCKTTDKSVAWYASRRLETEAQVRRREAKVAANAQARAAKEAEKKEEQRKKKEEEAKEKSEAA